MKMEDIFNANLCGEDVTITLKNGNIIVGKLLELLTDGALVTVNGQSGSENIIIDIGEVLSVSQIICNAEANNFPNIASYTKQFRMSDYQANQFEVALIYEDYDAIEAMLQKNELLWEDYSTEEIERISNFLKDDAKIFMKGQAPYNRACRVYSFQKNKHALAEILFESVLDSKNDQNVILKSCRQLSDIYFTSNEYEKYIDLMIKFPFLFPFNTKAFVSFYQACSACGRDGSAFWNAHKEDFKKMSLSDTKCLLKFILKNQLEDQFEHCSLILLDRFVSMSGIDEAILLMKEICAVEDHSDDDESLNINEVINIDESLYDREIVDGLLKNKWFGLFCIPFLKDNHYYENTKFEEIINDFKNKSEEMWNDFKSTNDQTKMFWMLIMGEYVGLSSPEFLAEIQLDWKQNNFGMDIVDYLGKFDRFKLTELIDKPEYLRIIGYTDKDISKFQRFLTNGGYPLGKSAYDIASRLFSWGFPHEATKYYITVANDSQNAKQKEAINTLLQISISTKNFELFRLYYENLDAQQKSINSYVKFNYDVQFHYGNYEVLYQAWKKEDKPSIAILQGALMYLSNDKAPNDRQQIISDLSLRQETFDYGFWKLYLQNIYLKDNALFRQILNELLTYSTDKCLESINDIYEIICIDEALKMMPLENEDLLQIMNNMAVMVPYVLICHAVSNENLIAEFLRAAKVFFEQRINAMEFEAVIGPCTYLSEHFPQEDQLQAMAQIAISGNDMKAMLPKGNDCYAKGKRILLLEEDPMRAESCFIEGIQTSDDSDQIAKCGTELLNSLLTRSQYDEVITWGQYILIEKGIVNYAPLNLNLKTAFIRSTDNDKKKSFINILEQNALQDLNQSNFQKFIDLIQFLDSIDPMNALVAQYSELRDKAKVNALNMLDDSFEGKANFTRFVEKDEEKYLRLVLEGIETGKIEQDKQTDITISYIDTCIESSYLDYIDSILEVIIDYKVPINEHLLEVIYNIFVQRDNITDSITYFSKLLPLAGPEKGNAVYLRLERLYEKALAEHSQFDIELALQQMLNYVKEADSLQAKLCYIMLEAESGKTEKVRELYLLLRSAAECAPELYELNIYLKDHVLAGEDFTLENNFNQIIKEQTLLQFNEHRANCIPFIVFSSEEEVFKTKITSNYVLNLEEYVNNQAFRDTLIKLLYLHPIYNYKFWYFYFKCNEKSEDKMLLFCLDNFMFITTPKNSGSFEHIIKKYRHLDTAINDKYLDYNDYNKLYRKFVQKDYLRNPDVNFQISKISTSKTFFKRHNSDKLAKDYIKLLKTMDDRDDYIYIKSAMFIATNNYCEEYFYDLFKADLLSREQNVCIRMCFDLLHKRKKLKFLIQVIDDFECANIDNEKHQIVALIRKATVDYNYSTILIRLTKMYPDSPSEEFIQGLMDNTDEAKISKVIEVMKDLIPCFENAASLKENLLTCYRRLNNESDYEDMYQLVVETTSEFPVISFETLFDLCRLALVLATVLKKKNRYSDIIKNFESKNVGDENIERLRVFCEICDNLLESDYDILYALIGNNWEKLFDEQGINFYKKIDKFNDLVDLSKVSFIQCIFTFLSASIERENKKSSPISEDNVETSESQKKIYPDINDVFEDILGESFDQIIYVFCGLTLKLRTRFINYIDLKYVIARIPRVSQWAQSYGDKKDQFFHCLVQIWIALTSESTYIDLIKKIDRDSAVYNVIFEESISILKSLELLEAYTNTLFFKRKYETIFEINQRFDWAHESSKFNAYLFVSMYISCNPDAASLLSQLSSETLINVVILLRQLNDVNNLQSLYNDLPAKKQFIDSTLQVLSSRNFNKNKTLVGQLSEQNDKIALCKLLYMRTRYELFRNLLIEQYGEAVSFNNYFHAKENTSTSNKEIGPNMEEKQLEVREEKYVEQEENNKIISEDSGYQLNEALINQEILFVLQAQDEVDLSEYVNGIPSGEGEKLTEDYSNLGSIDSNLMFRKEILSKLIYIAKSDRDTSTYAKYVIELGVVLFYIDLESAPYAARHTLYEAANLLIDAPKQSSLELVRDAVDVLLLSFNSFEDIRQEKNELLRLLDVLLKVNRQRQHALLYRSIKTIIEDTSESSLFSEAGRRTYTNMISRLHGNIVNSERNVQARKIYSKWEGLLQVELKKLNNDAVLHLEVETKQCGSRGKICGIISNIGGVDAKDIDLKIVFGEGVRCKDNEHKLGCLTAKDTITFAFPLRCQETNRDDEYAYSITISYAGESNETETYDDKFRFVADSSFKHIPNLYSLSPVTNNSEFYGREKEKEEIFDIINNSQYNTSIVMHGLKRVGKTSMLRYIERSLVDSTSYIPVYKSAQSIGAINGIGQMFVQSVVEALENKGLADDECRTYLSFNCSENPEKLYEFFLYLQKSNILQGKRILFMADEIEEIFDWVSRGNIKQEFYKVLRVILQELTSVRFIFCGADQLTEILHNHALADIFEVTTRVNISRLDKDSIRRMIEEPAVNRVTFTNLSLDRIWYYTQGHTFYTKQICSNVIQILNEEQRSIAYAHDVDLAVKQTLRITEHFGYLSRFFNENESQIIQIMCNNIKRANASVPFSLVEEQFKEIQGINYERSKLVDALESLEFRDIIVSRDTYNDENYKFSIEMFRLWYQKANSTGLT